MNTTTAVAGAYAAKLTTDEAASFLKLEKGTLRIWRVAGSGPPYSKLGRRVVYDVSDLEQWVRDRRRSSTSEDTRK